MLKVLTPLALSILCACGSSSDSYEDAVAEANAKEAEARGLGVDIPCERDQCGVLVFSGTRYCLEVFYQPYSLIAPSAAAAAAAASAAAGGQRSLANTARERLGQIEGVMCPAGQPSPPEVACVASRCEAAR